MKFSSNGKFKDEIVLYIGFKTFFMKKNEITEFIESQFKKIGRPFHKSIINFEAENIQEFLIEIKKLKTFLHLINMESKDGLSCRISKRMKTIYGYFGIIRNLQLQLKEVKEYPKRSIYKAPVSYINNLEKEMEYWKRIIFDFIDVDYNFMSDKQELLANLPDKLTKKSVINFIHYTLYELNTLEGRADDEALDNLRKFIEDIYYNYALIKPFIREQQSSFLNEKAIEECVELFNNFDDKSRALALLQTFDGNRLELTEKHLLKEMENERLNEKKDVKNRLISFLDSMNIKANNPKARAITSR